MAVEVRKEVPTVKEERKESRGEAMGKDGWVVVAIHLSVSVRWIGVGVRADLLKRQFNMFLKGGEKKQLNIWIFCSKITSIPVSQWYGDTILDEFLSQINAIFGRQFAEYVEKVTNMRCMSAPVLRKHKVDWSAWLPTLHVHLHQSQIISMDFCFLICVSSSSTPAGATKGLATGAEQGPLELNKNNGNGNMAFWTQQPWIVSSGSKNYFECLRLDVAANCATLILISTVSITEMLEFDSACHWAISSNP